MTQSQDYIHHLPSTDLYLNMGAVMDPQVRVREDALHIRIGPSEGKLKPWRNHCCIDSLWHCRWSSFLHLLLSQNAREPAHCSVPVSIELEPWEFWFQFTRATQLLHVEMRAVFSFFCRPLFGMANVSVHMKERGDNTGIGLSTHNVQPWD